MISYQVTLKTPEGELTLEVNEEQSIFEVAQNHDLDLPISCGVGTCSVCVGKLLEGVVDQSAQSFLCQEEIEAGFILTCIAKPLSDCTIVTHQEDSLY